MSDAILANLRRLYHHVVHGGTVTAEDLSRVIQLMERENNRGLRTLLKSNSLSHPENMI